MDTLFGGSKSQQTASSTPKDVTPGAFKAVREPFADVLKGLLGGGQAEPLAGVPESGLPTNAPITGSEQSILADLLGQTGSGTARQGLLNDILGGNFLPGEAGSNPFLQSAIEAAQRPTFQALEEVLSRTLPGRFTSAGQFTQPQGSTAFDEIARQAARDAQQTAGDIASKLSFGAFESERGRQQEAVSLSQQEVDTTVKNLQAQALPRLIEELGIERGREEFQTRLNALLSMLQTITGVTSPTIGNQQQSQGTSRSQNGIIPGLFPKGA